MEIDMSNLTEEQRIKEIIQACKNRYPKAVANRKDKNLLGKFLEDLTRQALSHIGLMVYEWPIKEGDRGIDAKVVDDSFLSPLLFAIECMNGRFDYNDDYFKYLKGRIERACREQHHAIIVCVNKKINFARFKGTFACNAKFVELGKQYHPNTTTYVDYLRLKNLLDDTIEKIKGSERSEEMAERKYKKREKQDLEDEVKALQALDEKRLKERENSE